MRQYLAAYPQHLADELFGIIDLLERLGQDDIVENIVRVVLDFLVNIAVNDKIGRAHV